MNTTVIAAHPDDEVLGCGGTIARLAAEGHAVSILILGEGITSRYPRREDAPAELLERHRERASRAGLSLGAVRVAVAGLPDQRFDTLPFLDVVHTIEAELAETEPELVLVQHGGDLNLDHAITFRAALTATRPVPGCRIRRVLAYEVGSSTEWSFQNFAPPFHPTVFYGIEGFLERKIEALGFYESEIRPFPHPRSPEALRAAASRWGSVIGVPAAEAFVLIRESI